MGNTCDKLHMGVEVGESTQPSFSDPCEIRKEGLGQERFRLHPALGMPHHTKTARPKNISHTESPARELLGGCV